MSGQLPQQSIALEITVRVMQDGRPVNLALLERTMANALPFGMELTDCSIRRVSESAARLRREARGGCV